MKKLLPILLLFFMLLSGCSFAHQYISKSGMFKARSMKSIIADIFEYVEFTEYCHTVKNITDGIELIGTIKECIETEGTSFCDVKNSVLDFAREVNSQNGKIKVSHEFNEPEIKVIITSDDPDIVRQLQNLAAAIGERGSTDKISKNC